VTSADAKWRCRLACPGERNVVLIAFRRDQQRLVDSWVPWLEQRAAADPGLRFAELPALGLRWEPARPAIDGGMAAAIRGQAVGRRTLTVYTDLGRVTVPLGIDDRSTIWLCLMDRAGRGRLARVRRPGPGPTPPPSTRRWLPYRSQLLLQHRQRGRRPSSSRWRSTPVPAAARRARDDAGDGSEISWVRR
jgi:hypothetical protein